MLGHDKGTTDQPNGDKTPGSLITADDRNAMRESGKAQAGPTNKDKAPQVQVKPRKDKMQVDITAMANGQERYH